MEALVIAGFSELKNVMEMVRVGKVVACKIIRSKEIDVCFLR